MNKFRINPITRKDLTITTRNMRFSWGLFAYELILTFVFLIAIRAMDYTHHYAYSNAEHFSNFVNLFPIISIAELCIVALLVPITTAGAITGEKERQTFDIMMTTQISPLSIVIGKMMTGISRTMIYVIASIPIMAVGFTIGGISWWTLLFYLALVLVLAIFEAAIGLFCSSVCKKTVTAIVMSYIIIAVVCAGTFIPILLVLLSSMFDGGSNLGGHMGEQIAMSVSLISVLPNPIMMFIEFYTHVIFGESMIIKEWADECVPGLAILGHGPVWIILSVIVILLVSMAFIALAAVNVDPIKRSPGKIRQDKKQTQAVKPAAPSDPARDTEKDI
ncbi:MAG: hypothetical protein J5842_01190 [Lachnospiraceae bacterium]|nr:hypothetical protein [Lachnospiraceae bacterium]